jgi:acetyl esterase/lipase
MRLKFPSAVKSSGPGRLHLATTLCVFWTITTAAQGDEPALRADDRDLPGIPYRELDELTQEDREKSHLDLYVSAGAKDAATVIWFHGGGLKGGARSVPDALRGQGFHVVAPSYRLSPRVSAPVYIEDAAAAVAWVFQNIEQYGGSRQKVIISGHSAGGYLAMMISLDKRWLNTHGIDANEIAGVVPFSGQTITHFTIRGERGIPDKQPVVDDMAPLFHVRGDAPPILLITGDREQELLGRYEENAYLWRMLKVNGHPNARLVELQGFDHGQMAEPAFPLLVRFTRAISGE